ncbi:MAG: DUF2059 domain-containing protein [Acetobacteraceae bacterium]|nr:DUF2059 domain-containing protein [Acetobacteraceae bacterium]
MIRKTLPLTLLLGMLAFGAAAQPARPDAAARAEAMDVIRTLDLQSTMERTLDALRPSVVEQLRRAGASAEEAERGAAHVVMPALRAATPQMLQGIADIWARHFTAAELRELRGFYDTPAGRKSLALTPVIAVETQAMVQTLIPRIVSETLAANRAALLRRGTQL